MKAYLCSIFFASLFISGGLLPLNAQQRLFAGRVNNFSTEYDVYPQGWSAYQILGVPNVYPAYGDIEDAFNPENFGIQRDFIDIGYDNYGPIDSIFIYQTYTPGFIDSVFVKNPGTQAWDLVYSAIPAPGPPVSSILAIGFPMTSYPVNELRLTLANDTAPDWVEIDAVSISPASTNIFTPETIPGSALDFDGVDDAFHSYSNLLNLITDTGATFTAWINIHQNIAPAITDVFDGACVLCDADGTYIGVYLGNAGGSDSLYFYNYDGADEFFGMDYTLDTWFHIALVHTNDQLKAYKNGVLYRTIPSGSTAYIGMRALEMGFNLSSGAYFEGEIDEVTTFNKGLNITEVNDVMHMNVPANMPGLTAYWQMSNCDASHTYNPKNHIADSLDGVSCSLSGVPDFTAIENTVNETSSIDIYPNPSTGIVHIAFNNITANYVAIYDIAGRMIHQMNIPADEIITLDLSQYPAGIYSIQVLDANQKTYVSKLIIH